MTLFGEKLKNIVELNDINIYRLSQKAGIERTIIHKIISGNRMPDIEYIHKLAAALPVSPFERDDLIETYIISKDGEFLYNQRIQVRQLIERMSAVREFNTAVSTGDIDAIHNYSKTTNTAEVSVVRGTLSVNNLVDDMLSRELHSSAPFVKFVLPHSYSFFYDNLFLKYQKTSVLKAECLFEFYKNTDTVREKRNVNLDVISALSPFIMRGSNFTAHYAYSMNPAGSSAMLPMPYFIVTSSGAATLTADLQTAIVFGSKDAADCYDNIFDDMKQKAMPLIGLNETMDETAEFYSSANIDKSTGIMGFGSHPCIAIFYDRQLLDAHLPAEIPDRKGTIETWFNVSEGLRRLSKKTPSYSYFTMEGLELFVEKGIIQTIVEKFFSPYSPLERADTVQKMIDYTNSGKLNYRVIDSSKLKIPECFYADVFGQSHMNIVINDTAESTKTIIIYEEGVVEAFYNFLSNAALTDIAYSKDDTLKVLYRALERAQEL